MDLSDETPALGYPMRFIDHTPNSSLVGSADRLITTTTETPLIQYKDSSLAPPPSTPSDAIQVPTPMESPSASSITCKGALTEEHTTISVSTAFHPGAHAVEPDTILPSSDGVLFYVHSQVLTSVSPRAFRRVFEMPRSNKHIDARSSPHSSHPGATFNVPDTSAVFNVILHMLYGTSSAQHSPSFETLVTAVDAMPYYDLNPRDYIAPRAPLFNLLLTHAPLFPLQLYALAGHHGLRELAIATSTHLLSYPLSNISEELAQRMGAVFLKRLLCLQLDRFNALKQILLQSPHPHPPTKQCSFTNQEKWMRAWAMLSARPIWDARPDLSTHSMQSSLDPLIEHLDCMLCHEALQNRIKDVVVQWASVKRTI